MGERTPGLWRVSSRLQVKSEKRLVADIITGYIPEAEANARFIAAAPDLYDFAEKFVVWAEDMPDENYEQVEIELIQMAKSAIAKAKGA